MTSRSQNDLTPWESKRPQIDNSVVDSDLRFSHAGPCSYPGIPATTPAGYNSGLSSSGLSPFRLSNWFFKTEKAIDNIFYHWRIFHSNYGFRPDLSSSSNDSIWHPNFHKIDREPFKYSYSIRRSDCTIVIMNYLHTTVDSKEQMTLPLSTILIGSHFASCPITTILVRPSANWRDVQSKGAMHFL